MVSPWSMVGSKYGEINGKSMGNQWEINGKSEILHLGA